MGNDHTRVATTVWMTDWRKRAGEVVKVNIQ